MNKDLNKLFELASKKFIQKIGKITNINGLFLDPKLDGIKVLIRSIKSNVHTNNFI